MKKKITMREGKLWTYPNEETNLNGLSGAVLVILVVLAIFLLGYCVKGWLG